MRVLGLLVLALLVGCGPTAAEIRRARYHTSPSTVRTTAEQVIRENYRYRPTASGSFRVGPIWFDREKRRILVEQPEPPDTAVFAIVFFVSVQGSDDDGYWIHIGPRASHFRDGRWQRYATTASAGDPFAHDSLLAGAADVIFQGIHARLRDVARDPTPKKRYPRQDPRDRR